MLNNANFKDNEIANFEEIEHIKHIEYFPEFSIINNPLANQPGMEGMISAIVKDLGKFSVHHFKFVL